MMPTRVGPFLSYTVIISPKNVQLTPDELEQEFRSVMDAWWGEQGRDALSVVSATFSHARRIVGTYPHKNLDEKSVLSVTGHFASPYWHEGNERQELSIHELEKLFQQLLDFIQSRKRIGVSNAHVLRY
jgi:hypothetical protein